MDRREMLEIADTLIAAWNSHDVERLVACYTADAEYRDPNTRGAVRGSDPMRRYLTKLFARWRMHWAMREAHLFADETGCAVLWRATFQRADGESTVDIEGIDFVEVRDGRIARNEVCFDRAQLAPLLQSGF